MNSEISPNSFFFKYANWLLIGQLFKINLTMSRNYNCSQFREKPKFFQIFCPFENCFIQIFEIFM